LETQARIEQAAATTTTENDRKMINPLTPAVAMSVRVPGCQKLQMTA